MFPNHGAYIDEEQLQIVAFLVAFGRIGTPNKQINQIQKVHQNGGIHLLQLSLVIVLSWIQTAQSLRLERSYNGIIDGYGLTEHQILARCEWFGRWWCTSIGNMSIGIEFQVAHGRQRECG